MPPKGWKKGPDGAMVPPDETPEVEQPAPAPGICGACWPEDWPDGAERAMCAHGTWTRGG